MSGRRFGVIETKEINVDIVKHKGVELPLCFYDKTTPPTTKDDITLGFMVGSIWVDVVGRKVYTCFGSTQGSAVWSSSTVDTTTDVIPSKSESIAGVVESNLDNHSVEYISYFLNTIRKIKTEIFFYSSEVECVWEKITHVGKDNTLKLTQDSFTSKLDSDVECSIQYSSEVLTVHFSNISELTSKKYKILVSEVSAGV